MSEISSIIIKIKYQYGGRPVEDTYSSIPSAVKQMEFLVKNKIDYAVTYTRIKE